MVPSVALQFFAKLIQLYSTMHGHSPEDCSLDLEHSWQILCSLGLCLESRGIHLDTYGLGLEEMVLEYYRDPIIYFFRYFLSF